MDVCAKLRGIFHEKRVGHAGTLDPMATGVLPVFIGRATRAVEFTEQGAKEYRAGLRLGITTDTQDTTGTRLEERPVCVDRHDVEAVLERFRGDILQTPPMYSAVKIGGKKLYELARKGKEVERKPRPVTLYELEILEQSGAGEYLLRAVCSKGTYIRTLCHEIGQALGCGGAMCSLRRTMAAGFRLEQAVTLEQIQAHPAQEQLLIPVETYFLDRPELRLPSQSVEKKVRNGAPVRITGWEPGEYRVYGLQGEFLMLGRIEHETLFTIKNFFEV